MLASTLLLSACVTTTGGGATKAAFCASLRPQSWSIKDSDQTIAEAKANNAVGVKVCGWKPPKKQR